MTDQQQLALPTDECAAEGCTERFAQQWFGQPRTYCSDRCRQRAHRQMRRASAEAAQQIGAARG